MLILTRRVRETIVIGDEITITVLGVKGNQIRFGIDAPKAVGVHREEVYARIQLEDQGASLCRAEATPKPSVAVRVKKSKIP